MPSEQGCRKPDWQPGAEVVLSDGQAWHFPRPRLVYRMHIDPVTQLPVMRRDASIQSESYGAMLDKMDDAANDAEFMTTLTALSLELLAQNYVIPADAVPDLFTFDPGSEVSKTRWQALANTVKGQASYPKP
ncbi:hypothetical protein UFOVP124_46 [uncultured Caudovirales phage]|uniref:Tail assembly chaperone n=1 Tax=uncultured Caudovirales phage TaxID=2100421 RepID=A0A6J5LCU1_9CAUD|nr:hypothetical protein UFOVP124_46 [uncultured Caudovirales phage]